MFYLLCLILILYNALLYAIFRCGIYDYLRLSAKSKTYIRKNRKGLKNYWLYSSIHAQNSLGYLYYWNVVFLFYTILFSTIAITMGFIKVLQPAVFIASIGLCIVEIPSVMIASVYNNRMEFGTAFVLFAKRKSTGKFYSSLVDMFSWVVTALLIYLSYTQL